MITDELQTKIDDRSDELLALLSELVSAKTVSGYEKPGQQIIIERFEDMGLSPDVWVPSVDDLKGHEGYFETLPYNEVGYDDRPNVVARLEGSGDGPEIALSGHIDVVPASSESEWTTDPWSLTQDGNTLYGRGVADMKGGLAAYIHAIQTIRDLDIELAGDVILQSTIEEEAGGVGGILSALERGYRPDAAIIPEPFEIPNIGIASAGVMYFEIRVPGKSIHAAWGHKGVNAYEKSCLIASALDELDRKRKREIDYEPAYRADPELEGNVTNINLGVVEAGEWPSTVPGMAVIKGRVGWPPGETREEVRTQIETAVEAVADGDPWLRDNRPQVSWFGYDAAPHEVDANEKIVRISKRTAEDVTGKKGELVGGNAALDERFYSLYYDTPAITVGPCVEDIHGVDESTTVRSLLDVSKTIALTVVEYCGRLQTETHNVNT